MKEFDFVRDRFKTVCPMCRGRFRADTCILFECKFRFFKIKISPSSRLEVIEPSEYENVPQNKIIFLDIKKEMKSLRWSQFKISPESLSDFEEFSPNEKCMFCFQIISDKFKHALRYRDCKHLIHKRCLKQLDRHDRDNCIKCDEQRGFDSVLNSSNNSPGRKKPLRQKKKSSGWF